MTYEKTEKSINVLESENELLMALVKAQAKLIKQLGKKRNKPQDEDIKEIKDLVTVLNVKYDRMEEFKDSQYKKDKVLTKRLDELEDELAELSSHIDYLINQKQ